MKVRNLKQYIEILTGNSNAVPVLGSAVDLLLKEFYGRVENLDQRIADLPNFATDARTQIFYELMQNAEDAESGSLHFFYDEDSLLILNNGLPFYTDSSEKLGQLFEFLFKSTGRKANDPSKIGEHGQGSKLLYTLIQPNTFGGDRKDAARRYLLHELRGPILFSWQRESDVMKLFTWDNELLNYTGNCEDLDYPLLVKIILTYYPAELGEVATLFDGRKEELFSKTEMASLVQFLNKIRIKVTWTDFRRGTLLYIPLGEGQGEKMVSTWGNALKQGISISMDFLKHLKYVYVNGEQIRRSGLHVVQLADLAHGEKPVFLQMAMPNADAQLEDSAVNFYKFFPIAKSMYGLNYLINTKAYDVGAARQEIDVTVDNNKRILKDISERIVEYIRQLREDENREALIQFLRCVLHNKPKGDLFFKEHFHDSLLQAFATNLPTETGFADSAAAVRIKKNAITILPEDLGMTGWDWLDESLADEYDRIEKQLGVLQFRLTDLVEEAAGNEQFKTWISGLSDDLYLQFLEGIQAEVKSINQIQNLRCWRFSNGEVYTLKEILEQEDLILMLPEIKPLGAFLRSTDASLGGWELDRLDDLNQLLRRSVVDLSDKLWSRVTTKLSALDGLIRDDKWSIFRVYKNDAVAQKYLSGRLSIFVNTQGEKKALEELSNQTTNWAPSGILDALTIRASEVIPEMQSYFINKEAVWPYLLNNWELVEIHLSKEIDRYKDKIRDLDAIYQTLSNADQQSDDMPWILLPSGELASSVEVFAQESFLSLSAGQYTQLNDFIASNTDLKPVDKDILPAILAVEFAPAPPSGLKALKNVLREDEMRVQRTMLEILFKIRKKEEGFFRLFTIQKNDFPGQYTICKNDERHIQYYSQDKNLIEFLEQEDGFALMPKELLNIFEVDNSLKNEPVDDDFILDLIEEFKAAPAFIDIVSSRNINIQGRYLEKLSTIDLCSGSEPITYKGRFEFKVVKIITSHEQWITSYKRKIQIDGINITDFEYTDEVKIGDVKPPFSLARLLPEKFGDLTGKLAAIKPKMEGRTFGKLLENKKYDPIKIVSRIETPGAYHLAFLLSFYQYKPENSTSWDIESISWENVNKEDALQEFYKRKMTFFSDFDFPDGWFNIHTAYATTDPDLLLEQEKVYPWILEWMDKDDDVNHKRQFLTDAGLRDASDLVIQLRRKFRNEESFYEQDIKEAFSHDIEKLEATLRWIRGRFDTIELKSTRDVHLRKILDYYWVSYNKIPQEVPILHSVTTSNKIQMQFVSPDWDKVRYITVLAKEKIHLWKQIIEEEDYLFIFTSKEDGDKFREGISLNKKVSEARLTESIDIPDKEPRLWEDKVYQTWKAEEKVNLNIYLLDRPVPFSYYFETENISVPIDALENVKADRNRDDIYIHQEFPNEDIYKVLSDHQDVLFKKDPDKLVRLLAKKLSVSIEDDNLLTDNQKDKIRNNPESYRRIIDLPEEDILMLSENADKIVPFIRDSNIEELHRLILETDKNTRSQILDHIDLIKTMSDMDLFDILGQLLKKADKEQLEKLVEMWDEIEQELEKEKSNPKPVALIGYIGERLVYLWLMRNEKNLEDVEHVGLDRLPYDVFLHYNNNPFFIEVKTTIKSVKDQDETIPFFLRASQYEFIQSHPNEDYVVVRLSLSDLGLSYLYDTFKVMGPDLDVILHQCKDQIDEHLNKYLSSQTSANRFKTTRMIFKMNIPKFDQEFWEE